MRSPRSCRRGPWTCTRIRPTPKPTPFETARPADKAFVIHCELAGTGRSLRSAEGALEEAASLTAAIGIETVRAEIVNLQEARPATFLGQGKVDEIGRWLEAEDDVKLVIVNAQLSPVQHRNLERAWKAKVLDRTALILEIFGERAQTREGTLQVALAHLTFQRSRLVRSWTHLERQRGGAGFLGGPGERQIESDRRILAEKIDRLKAELEEVRRTRNLQRRKRKRAPSPVIALVGYTNAGKSTLFKRITGEDTFAKDLLFATLDPLMRKIELPSGLEVVLSDTVGFISDLPTHLVASFRATLEEVLEADIVVHVRDISHDETDAQRADVIKVLAELGLTEETDAVFIEAWNKIDALPDASAEDPPSGASHGEDRGTQLPQDQQAEKPSDGHHGQSRGERPVTAPVTAEALRESARQRAAVADGTPKDPLTVALSAQTGEGVEDLLDLIDEELTALRQEVTFELAATDGQAAAWLYRHGDVLSDLTTEGGTRTISVRLEKRDVGRFAKEHGLEPVEVDKIAAARA
ncbi:GTPase HflX [Parvularcula lutaonensis]|uniref:GTPase HflX n=1 Tax=Parvularcula lutaonensis TaxID=491923 RepID=A0ABV7MFA1_9PROT|nr:GTPase HflX [Parvularcula lutaonensis]